MDLPSYDQIGGPAIPNPERGGKKYKIYTHPDSQGNPGKWHIYWNGEPQFIADPQPSAAAYSTPPPAPAPVAPAPPPAAPAPPPPQQPAPQPQPAQPASEPKPAGGTTPQPTTGDNTWFTNNDPNSDRRGERYQIGESGTDSQGRPGRWHIYEGIGGLEGDKVFVPEPQPSGATYHSPSTSEAGATTAPTPEVSAAPAPASESRRTPNINPRDLEPAKPIDEGLGRRSSSVSVGGSTHTVVQGDTMWDIAQANNMSVADLKALNPQIEDPNLIRPGEKINLGGSAAAPTVADSGAFPTTSSYNTADNKPKDSEEEIIVGWADTGSESSDPMKNLIPPADSSSTDPLKINKDNTA